MHSHSQVYRRAADEVSTWTLPARCAAVVAADAYVRVEYFFKLQEMPDGRLPSKLVWQHIQLAGG